MTTSEFLRSAWTLDFFTAALCGILVLAYVLFLRTKSARLHRGLAYVLFFVVGFVALLLALVSPVAVLARQYLFSAHMLQHLLLLLVVPALFLMALPKIQTPNAPQKTGSFTGLNWLCSIGTMSLWHVPTACNAAETSAAIFHLQTISLLAAGAIFWWPIVGPRVSRRLPPLAGILYLFTACLACTLLGIYITFTPVSICPIFLHAPPSNGILSLVRDGWGIQPMVDQRIGGLMMWVPACMIYLAGILGLLARWYREGETGTAPNIPLPEISPKQI